MADGTARPTSGPTGPGPAGATPTRARRSWRLAVEKESERPDYAVVRRLILGSALMLFLELALIRWLGANVVHLSYFSNFVLLGSWHRMARGLQIGPHTRAHQPAAPRQRAGVV